eukprot:scaffold44778_cov39-Prasinocladus_malaysianus.AAC.1
MGKSKSHSRGPGKSPSRQMGVDRQLVRRVEAHAAATGEAAESLDVDEVLEELRRSYREYQRIKLVPLKAMVGRAIDALRQRERDSAAPSTSRAA